MKCYDWHTDIPKTELREVVTILKNDGIIIFPTETVYGIGGNALKETVLDKICTAKNRPREKAISIILKDKEDISKYATVSPLEKKLIDAFMPGPLTLVLNDKKGDETIGIIIPDNKICRVLLEHVDFPLYASSANFSGKTVSNDPSILKKEFSNLVEALIDGGPVKIGSSSTVAKLDGKKVTILREGKITLKDIEKVLKS